MNPADRRPFIPAQKILTRLQEGLGSAGICSLTDQSLYTALFQPTWKSGPVHGGANQATELPPSEWSIDCFSLDHE
jgi:hypothetical protein